MVYQSPLSAPPESLADRAFRLTETALAAGTHSTRHDGVCSVCRRVVPDLVFVASTGGGGIAGSLHFCADCAPKGPAASEAVVHARAVAGKYARRDVWRLDDHLIWWGCLTGHPAAAAIGAHPEDDDYCDDCVGALFRARAFGPGGAAWLDAVLMRWPADVRRLRPCIRGRRTPDPPPGAPVLGWMTEAWLDAQLALLGVDGPPDDGDQVPTPPRPAPQIGAPRPPIARRPRYQTRPAAGPALFGGS